MEERHVRKASFTHQVADSRYVRFVGTIGTEFILHLHHDDVSAAGNLQVGQLLTYFLHEDAYTFHVVGIERTELYILFLQEPPGQTAHFPFGAYIGTRSYDDVHAVLLCQATELGNVFVPCEVELTFFLFVQVPENVEADCVHAQCFARFDTLLPVGFGNTRIVDFGGFHHHGISVQEKRALSCLECACRFLRTRRQTAYHAYG